MRRGIAALLIGGALLARANSPGLAAGAFWQGRSAGFDVEWTSEDLVARDPARGEAIFSARSEAKTQASTAGASEKTAPCHFERQIRLLSLAGPYLSFEQRDYSSCEGWAHPAEETRFRSIDLRRLSDARQQSEAAADLSLTDFFAADEISRALRANTVIRRSLAGPLPHELPDLLTLLSATGSPPEGMCFSIPANLLQRFAFHDLRDRRAAIRLGLPGSGPCRAKLTELDLFLTPRPRDKALLAAAKKRQYGILMVDADRLLGRNRTTIAFDYHEGP
jgi:hypothetical protein